MSPSLILPNDPHLYKHHTSIYYLSPRHTNLPLTLSSFSPLPRRNNNITLYHNHSYCLKHTLPPNQHYTHHFAGIRCLWNSSRSCFTNLNLQHIRARLRSQPKPASMLKIIIPTTILLPITWLSKNDTIWINLTIHSLAISLIPLLFLNQTNTNLLNHSTYLSSDPLTTPLLTLTIWLLPLMITASQYHLCNEPPSQKKLFLFTTILLQITLILTFMTTELIIFYILFETTLIPTLIIITKWGSQAKRLNASTYFLFYTLTGSLPLLIILSHTYNNTGSLNITLLTLTDQKLTTTWSHNFTWLACIIAFMTKIPLSH